MSELNAIKFSDSNLIWVGITCILLFFLPLLYVFIWRYKCQKRARFKALFIGAAGFLISARVLELGIHVFCILLDNPVSRFINGHTAAYVIYGICMAGVFEECGRYMILRYLVKKENTRENAVMYGIGHGGIEVWTISLVSVLTFLAIAVTFRTYPLQEAMNLLQISDANVCFFWRRQCSRNGFGTNFLYVYSYCSDSNCLPWSSAPSSKISAACSLSAYDGGSDSGNLTKTHTILCNHRGLAVPMDDSVM